MLYKRERDVFFSFLLLHPFGTLPCHLTPPHTIFICGHIWIKTEPRLAFPPVQSLSATAVHLIRSLFRGTKLQNVPGSSSVSGSLGPQLATSGDQAAPGNRWEKVGGTSLRVPQLAAWSTDLRCSQTDTRPSLASRILPRSRAFRLSGQIYKEQRESCRLILHPGSLIQPHWISEGRPPWGSLCFGPKDRDSVEDAALPGFPGTN